MTNTNTEFNQKTTQMTDTKQVTYILENDWDGTLQSFNNLQDAFAYLGDYDLKKWYDSRDDIPAKSNFIIQKVVDRNPSTIIIKVKANKLFNLKK